ncbi:hypothetical protein AB0D27_11355 [Streptomyces sp. NPDC048415]|uniref:hypothetical protein n=1 Tax=Streptomyces sp. NPDC048415 TaxID=3154822 RepID=UPI00341F35BC
MSAPIRPKPPGPWRAIARDAVLNPEEAAARAAAIAEAQRDGALVGAVAGRCAKDPKQMLKPYVPILHRAGWRVRFTADEHRARIEAFHPDGAAVMLTAVPERGTLAYVLYASTDYAPPWLATSPAAIEHFAQHRKLPPGGRRIKPGSKCDCGKKGRFPTEAWAKKALTDIRIKRALSQRRQGAERRAYRCPHDDRVWHLTHTRKWYSEKKPKPKKASP